MAHTSSDGFVLHVRTTVLIFLLLLLGAPLARADLSVFACESEWAALTQELGGEKAEVFSATTGLQDVHFIQARPSLIARLRKADLLVCTGADLEIAWLPVLLRKANNPAVQPGQPGFLKASDHVDLLEKPRVIDRAEGDIHPYGNPHIQTDPRNIALVAEALSERLQTLDPDNGAYYRERHASFENRWSQAIEKWSESVSGLRGRQIVVHHNSWVYMNHWIGLSQLGTLEPKPGVPPSASHLARLLARIETEEVGLIVRAAYQSGRASEWLSRRAGIPRTVLPNTVGSVEGTDTLYGMFDVMVERLLTMGE